MDNKSESKLRETHATTEDGKQLQHAKPARSVSDAAATIIDTVAQRVTSILSLSLLKAVANRARPRDYPIDASKGGTESLFLRQFDRLPPAQQAAATERVLRALEAHGGRAREFQSFGELARLDLRSAVPLLEQAAQFPVFGVNDPAINTFLNHYGAFDLGAAALQLRIHRIKCHDETGISIRIPNPLGDDVEVGGEAGEDEIYLAGIAIDPTRVAPSVEGVPNLQTVEIPPYYVGDFDDGDEVVYNPPRVFYQFDLTRGLPIPRVPFSVLFILAERDNGDVNEIVKTATDLARHAIDEGVKEGLKGPVEEALKPKPHSGSMVGSHGQDTGPHQTDPHGSKKEKGGGAGAIIAAAIAALIGAIIGKVIDALDKWIREWWGNDLFPPQMVRQEFPGPDFGDFQLTTAQRSVVFEAHDGKYELWYDWHVVEKPRRQQHLFYRGNDGAVNHIFWDERSNHVYHDQWTYLTGAPPAAGRPATLVSPNQQHIFYRGVDSIIHHVFWDATTNKLYHDQWTTAVGAPRAAGDPATMAWPDQQHIFYRGADGHVNHIFWDAPTNKLYYDQWTSATGAPPAAGDPATLAWPGQQHIFYRGTDGVLHHIFWDADTNKLYHDQWNTLTGAPPAAGDPATMAWPDQQHIFYRGADGHVNHIFWDAPTNKLYYDRWTAAAGAPPATGDPSTLPWPDQQHIFYRGADGHVNHIFWDADTNKLYHDQWNTLMGTPSAAGEPATLAWPDQQHIFYRGQDSHIHHIFYDAGTNKLYTDQWTVITGVHMASGDKLATMVTG